MPLFDDGWEGTSLLFLSLEDLCFGHRAVGAVTRTFCIDAGPSHQFLDPVYCLGPVVNGLMMFAAHDDGFFRTGIDTEATIDAAHHIDVEPGREFFDFRVRVFTCFDVDALRGADCRAHIARNTFQAAVASYGKDMRAAESLGVGPGLLGIIDCRYVAFEEAGEKPPERDCKG